MQGPDLDGTRYSIVRHLARGGMGSVWLADDAVLNRRVALKVLDLVAPADGLGARLLQEARILAGLEHRGIVPVHDAGTLADGRAFYCMKYVEGQTLAQHIAAKTIQEKFGSWNESPSLWISHTPGDDSPRLKARKHHDWRLRRGAGHGLGSRESGRR